MARKSRKTTPTIDMISNENIEINSKKTFNVALYARLSVETKGNVEADTIGNQISLLKNYISEKENMKLYDVYCDNDITGTNFLRPEFERMMADISQFKINCIVVKDLSRFGRNYIEVGNYLEKVFPYYKVRFIAINDEFDTLSDDGNIIVPIKNIVNQLYAKDISRKICAAMESIQKSGKFAGSKAPYGYKFDSSDKHALLIDEDSAKIVKTIFEMSASHATNNEIVRYLNENNIPSPGRYEYNKGYYHNEKYKNAVWYTSVVSKILKNEIYLGWMIGGKFRSGFSSGSKKNVAVPKSQWIIKKGTHEAIIDEEIFYKVQALFEKKKEVFNENYGKYDGLGKQEAILKGKLICGECGKSMVMIRKVQCNKLMHWYACHVHEAYGNSRCTKKNVKKKEFEQLILTLIKNQMQLFTEAENMVCQLNAKKETKKKRVDLQEKMRRIQCDIEKFLKFKGEAYQDFVSNLLSETDFLEISESYSLKIAELRENENELSLEIMQYENNINANGHWRKLIYKYKKESELSSEMVEAFIHNITVYEDGNISIVFNYQDELKNMLALCEENEKGGNTIAV